MKKLVRLEKKNKTKKIGTNLKPFLMENKSSFIRIPLLILGIVLVVVLMLMFINKDNQYTFEGSVVQYYAGQKYPVSDDTKLSRSLEGVTQLTDSTGTREISSLAFYEEAESKIILPVDMVYYDPRSKMFDKIDAFTEIIVNDKEIVATNGNKQCHLNKGFLYDGKDYYIFLEDISLEFNGYKIDMSEMSYIEAVFQFQVTAFDYESKEFMMEVPNTDVVVTVDSGDYSVNVINDSYEDHKEQKSLLFTRPDLLDSLLE